MNPLLNTTKTEHTQLGSLPRASHALLFHCTGEDAHHLSRRSLELVTAHEVIHDRHGNPHIGPGRVALPSDEKMLADLLNSRSRRSRVQIVPPNILYQDEGTLAWWIPPERREMLLRDEKGGDHAITVQWPSLVALVVNRRLYLAATADTTRPHGDTELFHAPLGNIYASTQVCTGSARLPTGQSVTDLFGWTEVVTRTWFTHDNHPEVVRQPKRRSASQRHTNYRATAFWLKRNEDSPPPGKKDLTPLGLTLAPWIEAMIDTGDRP